MLTFHDHVYEKFSLKGKIVYILNLKQTPVFLFTHGGVYAPKIKRLKRLVARAFSEIGFDSDARTRARVPPRKGIERVQRYVGSGEQVANLQVGSSDLCNPSPGHLVDDIALIRRDESKSSFAFCPLPSRLRIYRLNSCPKRPWGM